MIGATKCTERELPEGWRWVNLGELCECRPGHYGAAEPFAGAIPARVLTVGSILNDGAIAPIDTIPIRYLSQNERDAIASEGDLLVVKSSGSATNIRSGKTGICPAEHSGLIAASNFLMRLVPSQSEVVPSLLWRILNSEIAKRYVQVIAGSTTYPNIRWREYSRLSIPLPQLAEQKRIAAILSEQIAAVDRARAATQAQLAAARTLPAAYLRQVFPGPGQRLLSGWRWVALRQVCEQDRRIVEAHSPLSLGLPYLSLEHIEANTGRILGKPAGSVEDEGLSTTFEFDNRHVLYGKLRPYLNKVALPVFHGRCTTEIIPLLPTDRIDRIFLCWTLRRSETVEAAMRAKTGSRMPRANVNELMSLEIPLPPLAEQKRMAALLNEDMTAVEKLQAGLAARLDQMGAMPAALLRRAFSGGL
jgi:restriction endonuclease S subunit